MTARNWRAAVLALLAILVWGCTDRGVPQSTVRPVRVFSVGFPASGGETTYAGEVKARYESRLSFRVPGKVVARHVEIGDRIRDGQLLAQIDPADYELAVKGLLSQLAAARAERDLAKDDLARYRGLLDRKFISQAEYDRRDTAHRTAGDRVAALEVQVAHARNQVAYTKLHADRNGVVTAIAAEAGQFASAGQMVLSLAQADDLEVAINVPEDRVASLRLSGEAEVSLWADGVRRLKGRIREISPAADPATRTYGVKVSLREGKDRVRLGMTATVHFPPGDGRQLAVPLAAVFQFQDDPGRSRVWVVEEETKTVKSVPVTLGPPAAGQQLVVSGISVGQRVVSAGVSRLREGQAVAILGEDKDRSVRSTRDAQAASIAPARSGEAGT